MGTVNMGEVNLDTNAYEKILLNFINAARPQLTGMDQTKKVTVKDLENLTSFQFQQLVMIIFGERASSELKASTNGESRSVKLEKFNNVHTNFDFSYDVQPLMFYRALKKYFPQPDELLTPSVVLNPSGDPLRTRRILKFLTTFSLYVEQVESHFVEVYDSLEQENADRYNLKDQLDKLKDEINKRMIDLEDWSQQVPQLQEESKTKQEFMIELQLKAEKLEEQVKALSTTYNLKDNANKQTNREIEMTKKKIQELEQQIVHSPMSIKRELEFEKEKIKEISKRRDILGAQLNSITQKRASVGHIGTEGEKAVGFFNELIHILQEAMDLMTSCKEKTTKNQQKLKEIEELEIRLDNIHCRQVSSRDGIYNQAQSQSDALKSLRLDISSTTVKIAELKHEGKHLTDYQAKEEENITLKQTFITDLQGKIENLEYYLTVEIPAKKIEMEKCVREVIEGIKGEFADI